ncbi:MAG: response regulator [Nocardioidaceae bacterium]
MLDVINAVVVDEDPLARRGMRDILSAEPGIDVQGEGDSADSGYAAAAQHRADVVVISMDLPDEAGFTMTQCITGDLEGVDVILIGLAITFGELLQAVQSGARGILSRAETVTQLTTAVRAIAAGEGYLGFRQAADLFALLQRSPPSAPGNCSDEQRRWHLLSL